MPTLTEQAIQEQIRQNQAAIDAPPVINQSESGLGDLYNAFARGSDRFLTKTMPNAIRGGVDLVNGENSPIGATLGGVADWMSSQSNGAYPMSEGYQDAPWYTPQKFGPATAEALPAFAGQLASGGPARAALMGVGQMFGDKYGETGDAERSALTSAAMYAPERIGMGKVLGNGSIFAKGGTEALTESAQVPIEAGVDYGYGEETTMADMGEQIREGLIPSALLGATGGAADPGGAFNVEPITKTVGWAGDKILPPSAITPDGQRMPIPQDDGVGDQTTTEMVGGPKSKNADLDALQVAEDMAEQGATEDEIFEATGWWLGHPDGKPRYEFSDDQAKLTGAPGAATIGDWMNHPELSNSYDPENIKLTDGYQPGTKGSYNPDTDTVNLSEVYSPEEAKSTALHEVQHGIQEREDTARGGSPAQFKLGDLPQNVRQDYIRTDDELKRFIMDVVEPAMKPIDVESRVTLRNNPNQMELYLLSNSTPEIHAKYKELSDAAMDAKLVASGAKRSRYERLAGETEARMTQQRADMTQAERDADPFYKNYDINNEDMILTDKAGNALDAGKPSDPAIGPDQVRDQVYTTGSANPDYAYQVGKMGPKAPTPEAAVALFKERGGKAANVVKSQDYVEPAPTYDVNAKAPDTADADLVTDMEGAIMPNGDIELYHYTDKNLENLDPAFAGTGADAVANARGREKYNMSWTGVKSKKDPYVQETDLTGSVTNRTSIDPAKVYNVNNNPKLGNLYDAKDINGSIERMKKAGYKGMRINHPNLGNVVGLFDKTKTQIRHIGPNKPADPENQMGPPEPTQLRPTKKPTVVDEQHDMGVERGERATGKSRMAASEKAAMKGGVDKNGKTIPAAGVEKKARAYKAEHPESDGWAKLEVIGVNEDGSPKYKPIPYGFNRDKKTDYPTQKTHKPRVKALAKKVRDDFLKIKERATGGDMAAKVIMNQAKWYSAMRKSLRREFGAGGDLFADILGASSPQTPVAENWKNALVAAQGFARGDYDKQIEHFNKFIADGGSPGKYPVKDWIKKPNGKNFGINGANLMLAMTGSWDQIRPGTAPKARNFSGNLIGRTTQATIDLWAGRYLRRMNGEPAIPPQAEKAVTGNWNAKADKITGEFGFGQEVMGKAAKSLGVDPDEIQAMVWFGEKEHWTEKGWTTSKDAEGGSFEQRMLAEPQTGYQAGVTSQTDAKVFPSEEQLKGNEKTLTEGLRKDDSVTTFKATPTIGQYGGDNESSMDFEFTANSGFDPTDTVQRLAQFGKDEGQIDTFLSRKLKDDEVDDNYNARPGMEIIFSDGATDKQISNLMAKIRKGGLDGFTMMQDQRPEVDRPQGIRMQFIPEIALRFDKKMQTLLRDNPDRVYKMAEDQAYKMYTMLDDIQTANKDIIKDSFVQFYDTLVMGQENYDQYTKQGPNAPSHPEGNETRTSKKPPKSVSQGVSERLRDLDADRPPRPTR